MHKQILVVILLFLGTGPGYILMGLLYSSSIVEISWFLLFLLFSLWGFKLYKNYSRDMSIKEKDAWLEKVKYFMFIYFSLWTIMFLYYISKDNISAHYIAIATQLGSAVVAATILASQKKTCGFNCFFFNASSCYIFYSNWATFFLYSCIFYHCSKFGTFICCKKYACIFVKK